MEVQKRFSHCSSQYLFSSSFVLKEERDLPDAVTFCSTFLGTDVHSPFSVLAPTVTSNVFTFKCVQISYPEKMNKPDERSREKVHEEHLRKLALFSLEKRRPRSNPITL